ncbi:TPA: LysR family transcriptional regulator [Enterobacter cloacae]|nr:LysR family transcriptional regulator [Enterobacter cloacae]
MNAYQPNKLDYNLIPVLIAIVETGSMIAAAEAMDVAPSAISYTVKKLRLHYNDPLFIRTLNGVRPTALAQNLYNQFKEINEHIITTFNNGRKTKLNQSQFFIQAEPLAELLTTKTLITSGFIGNEVSVTFKNGTLSQDERLYKLRNQEVDVDIGLILPGDRNIITKSLFEWRYVLICGESNNIIKDSLSRDSFLSTKYIAYNSMNYSTIMSCDMGDLLLARKFEPKITSESSINMVFTLLLSDYVMIIPDIYFSLLKEIIPIRVIQCDFIPNTTVKQYIHFHKKNKNHEMINTITDYLRNMAN